MLLIKHRPQTPHLEMVDMNLHAPSLRFSITELYEDAGPNIFQVFSGMLLP